MQKKRTKNPTGRICLYFCTFIRYYERIVCLPLYLVEFIRIRIRRVNFICLLFACTRENVTFSDFMNALVRVYLSLEDDSYSAGIGRCRTAGGNMEKGCEGMNEQVWRKIEAKQLNILESENGWMPGRDLADSTNYLIWRWARKHSVFVRWSCVYNAEQQQVPINITCLIRPTARPLLMINERVGQWYFFFFWLRDAVNMMRSRKHGHVHALKNNYVEKGWLNFRMHAAALRGAGHKPFEPIFWRATSTYIHHFTAIIIITAWRRRCHWKCKAKRWRNKIPFMCRYLQREIIEIRRLCRC